MSELRISASGPELLIEITATSIPSDTRVRKFRAPPPCTAKPCLVFVSFVGQAFPVISSRLISSHLLSYPPFR
ncbi:BZ3500_MvSof-1268-A1-R1_Chr7-1g09265 [Microbotryum saponariae]|uniref:BZ3500_MvSof-1268-A1-R1_Chr7-1g09265 protein n=1 Tax=Microbotryum saponariae TaxID=289078 RepID=A0A2X0L314_9BASI|nr:BZ3501_MvSof-1269-A2-R1_Chr7-1g08970 [Microbotryum saponariae]SDA03115.1 BZ3500_MvSof-1268-A1-R1_Chr7-1g09265 [Microbotryum saponariae]